MKEFEKWYKKEHKRESNPNVFYGAELGWKAALEWIQREYMKAREGRDVRFDLGLWDMLKYELDEETD